MARTSPFHSVVVVFTFMLLRAIPVGAQGGANDPTFNPLDVGNGNGDGFAPYDADAVAVMSDGRYLVGGEYQAYNGAGPAYLVRLDPDGARDVSFLQGSGPDGRVTSVVALPLGQALIVGGFSHYDGAAVQNVARLLPDGTLDPTFTAAPGPDLFLTQALVQPDGKVLVAGMRYLNPDTAVNWVGRLNTDGSLDNGFAVANAFDTTDGNVIRALALDPSGDVLVGGRFNAFNGTSRSNILRLNSDGMLDTGFDPGTGFNSEIWSLAVRPDGRVLAAGFFTSVQGAAHRGLVQLDATGVVDPMFDIGIGFSLALQPFQDAQVFKLLLRPDGKVFVSGWYDELDGQPQRGLVRLGTDGSVDATFDVGTGCPLYIYDMVQPSGDRLLAAGTFTSFNDVGVGNIVLLQPDGSVDETFNAGTGFTIISDGVGAGGSTFGTGPTFFSMRPDGSFYAGGLFHRYNGSPRNRLVHVQADGAVDPVFDPGAGFSATGQQTSVNAAVVQADGRVVVGGSFSAYNGDPCGNIARLGTDGVLDPAFTSGAGFNGWVDHLAQQPDGKILVSGAFSSYNGTARLGVARLNADGTLDAGFAPSAFVSGPLALQTDGRIIVGGSVRLFSDGSTDPSWSVGDGFNGMVHDLALQPDGRLLVGGEFEMVDNVPRRGIVRLNSDGSVDASFDPGNGFGFALYPYGGSVFALNLQADGRVVTGGRFDLFNGVVRGGIDRLNSDGSLDSSFDPGSGVGSTPTSGDSFTGVLALAQQPDGRLIVGGFFTSYDGIGRNRIARLLNPGICLPTQLTTTPDPVITCGVTDLKFDGTSTIAANEVPGANKYQFRFTNSTGEPAYTRNIAFATRSFTLLPWHTKPLKAGRTYNVVVRASFDNGATWCPYGPSCTVKVSWTPLPPAAEPRDMEAVYAMEPELNLYPNPNNGDQLRILLSGADEALTTATFDLTDLFGKRVMSTTLPIQDGEMNTLLSIRSDLASGLYFVTITAGTDRVTERLVIQH